MQSDNEYGLSEVGSVLGQLAAPVIFSVIATVFILLVTQRASPRPDPWIVGLSSFAFGLMGTVVALLYVGGGASSVVSGALPEILVAAAFLFQLAGRLKDNWSAPMGDKISLSGAVAAVLAFLFSSFYFGEVRCDVDLIVHLAAGDECRGDT